MKEQVKAGKRVFRWMTSTSLCLLASSAAWGADFAPATSTTPFSIVVIPDSQIMVQNSPSMFTNQVKWIKDNKSALNIKFVSHVGDLVNDNSSNTQWTNASNAMYQMDGVMPYAIAPGNHDTGSGDFNTFNTKFPYSKFSGQSWYGGAYNNKNHNSYQLFSTNGMDFIIIHLAYGPDASERAWASGILNQYPNRRAIISTHDFLGSDGRSSNGNNIWSDVVTNHKNVFMVVCGHNHYERSFTYKNNFGNDVKCLLADYQDESPQIAKLRYYTFKPGENKVYAYTYSTYKNAYSTGSSSQFSFNYTMTGDSGGTTYPSVHGKTTMTTNTVLNLNEYLVSSNAKFRFYLQGDGNLVLRNMTTNQVPWTANTNGKNGSRLILQSDSNLVLYTSSGSAVWSSNTVGKGGVRLVMQDDGNLVMFNASNSPVWSTGTGGGGGSTGTISYFHDGGVNNTEATITRTGKAYQNDYEIVAIGGSTVVGGDNQPINSSLMTGQGFTLIGCKGTSDKKAEIWIRKNNGSTTQKSIKIPGNVNNGKDLAYSITTIPWVNCTLDFSKFTVATYSGGHAIGMDAAAKLVTPSGSGFTYVVYFFDDSAELRSATRGTVLFKTWGHGDGDGLGVMLFQPGVTPPTSAKVWDHDSNGGADGGEEFVTVSFKSNH